MADPPSPEYPVTPLPAAVEIVNEGWLRPAAEQTTSKARSLRIPGADIYCLLRYFGINNNSLVRARFSANMTYRSWKRHVSQDHVPLPISLLPQLTISQMWATAARSQ
jgi:hypothetical protein